MNLVFYIFIFVCLYFLPGFIFRSLFSGILSKSFFWSVLFSFILVPFYYLMLVFLKQVNLVNYLLLLTFTFVLVQFWLYIKGTGVNLDRIFLRSQKRDSKIAQYLTAFILAIFFVMLLLPRLGLLQGYLPVGDDKPRVGQVLSIAASPEIPLHYGLPATTMDIYFYHMVQPGLLVKFTDNYVKVNHAWFIHLVVTYLLFIWLINLLANSFARTSLEKVAIVFGMTLFGGLEFFLSRVANYNGPSLEWWTDWISTKTVIHMQISAPYTSSFWVTQHQIAVYLVFLAYFLLISLEFKKPLTRVVLALIVAAVVGNSIFVFIPFAIAYAVYFLIKLILRQEKFVSVLKQNLIVILLALGLTIPLFLILIGSGKENYFIARLNSFFIFDNTGVYKVLNLLITPPLYLLVELSFLLIGLVYFLIKFFRNKLYLGREFFLVALCVPLLMIFFVQARGDNNLAMRGTLPAVTVAAIFTGWLIGDMWKRFNKNKLKKKILVGSLVLLALVSLPTTFYEASHRFSEQFGHRNDNFNLLERLPFNSIIYIDMDEAALKKEGETHLFADSPHDNIIYLGHRLTMKPVRTFNISDIEYTSQEAKDNFATYSFNSVIEIKKILDENPELKSKFNHYLLSPNALPLEKVYTTSEFNVYSVK